MLQDIKMRLKIAWVLLMFSTGCQNNQDRQAQLRQLRQQLDKAAEARIDSAYSAINKECDSLMLFRVPLQADSILRLRDSLKQISLKKEKQP